MVNEFSARVVKGGRVCWSRPSAAKAYFESLEGRRVKIIVEEPTRTKALNRLLHAIFKEFSQRTGYSPAQSKEFLKVLYVHDGRGTSEMGISEASDFAEFSMAWMEHHL